MVFYLKYRPQKIEELDTLAIRQSLGAVLSSPNIPHAFLFTGPRGLGKTSAARIVAKSVNCLKGQNGAVCGQCTVCQAITEGRHLDVLEIDAASNRGIDEIRDLREKIKFAPSSARYKVYIIDEVHMLTTEAFNALLKTLEEPPKHAIFVLCTTESHKLPLTIISRCLKFDFKRANKEDLLRSIERIVKGEKLKVKQDVLEEIAQGADGSFRDAAKILEQATFSGKEITKEQIKEILGESQNLKPEELLKCLLQKDTRRAILEVNRLAKMGENLRVYTEKILSLLHRMLMVKVGVEEDEDAELGRGWEKEQIIALIELFSRAYGDLKTAVVPQLPLELAVVEWCEAEKSGSPANNFFGSQFARDENKNSNQAPSRSQGESSNPPTGGEQAPQKVSGQKSSAPSLTSNDDIVKLWPQIIEATKEYNHTLAGVLRGCRPQSFDGKILTIETFYKFHKDKLNEPKVRELLGKALASVFERKVGFNCVLGEKEEKDRK